MTNESKPWLSRKDWAANEISSGAKYGHLLLWGFAVIWNLLSMPVVLLNYEDILRQAANEPMVYAVFLFPVIGVYIIILAIMTTSRWKKNGPTPLRLDPFPGSIGGQVGGYIDTNIAYHGQLECAVTLACVYSYMSGSGDNRSQRENVKWQSDGVCHFEPSAKGTRFIFRFDVPADLPPSDIRKGSTYHFWRVSIDLNNEEVEFNRQFEIPVFVTGDTGEKLSGIRHGTEDHHATTDKALAGIESIADIRPIVGGVEAYFPAFQRSEVGSIFCIVGLMFFGIGLAIGLGLADKIFPGIPIFVSFIFSLSGLLIALFGFYLIAKSLLISVTREGITSQRFLLGVGLSTQKMIREDFAKFEIKQRGSMQSGNTTTVHYTLYAVNKTGDKLPLGERLSGRAEAEVLEESFKSYLA